MSKFHAFLLLSLGITVTKSCHTFDKTETKIREVSSTNPRTIHVSGCIERVTFNESKVEDISITNGNLPELQRDSIRHMHHLLKLELLSCGIRRIHPETFRNIPNIKEIKMNGNNIVVIPSGAFAREMPLKILNLDKNNIFSVEDFANMPALEELSLSNNRIEQFDGNWFENTTRLKSVNLSFNKIQQVPSFAFKYVKGIKLINLDYNGVYSIAFRAFHGLKSLDYLGLHHNKLKTLEVKAFPGRIHIKSLKLSANRLNFLSQELRSAILVEDMFLQGNPFLCKCLDVVHEWLKDINGSLINNDFCAPNVLPTCIFPRSDDKKWDCTEKVDLESTNLFLNEIKFASNPHVINNCINL